MQHTVSIFWFRRDLRLDDNAALYHALKSNNNVLPIFIFDTDILDKLDQKNDARVSFLHHTICSLQDKLLKENTSLIVLNTTPVEAFRLLLKNYKTC